MDEHHEHPSSDLPFMPHYCHSFPRLRASSCFSCFVFSMLASAQMIKNPPGERPGFDP